MALPKQTYRGGALPRSKHYFYSEGKTYRVPMFLSSTTDLSKAREFMGQATDPVMWTFIFDPDYGCNHVNLVDRHDGSLGGNPHQAAEAEWVFGAYSVFTVTKAVFKLNPTWMSPHMIEVRVAPDNRLNLSGPYPPLPNAPWA